MYIDPNFVSDTTKVLKAIGLEKEYRDLYRTSHGGIVLEKKQTKEEIEIPYELIELVIKKYRGFEQKILLDQIKNLILKSAAPTTHRTRPS